MDKEKLYARLPVALQQVAVSLEGRRIQRERYDGHFHEMLAQYDQRARWEHARMEQFRDERLAAFVSHAAKTAPHYRDLFHRLGIAPEAIRGIADLALLPVLAKREVQANPERFRSEAVPESECIVTHTSGSTGAGLRFPITRSAYLEQWAVWWRYRRALGLSLDTYCLYFGGRSIVPLSQRRKPFWRYNRPGRQTLFSGYHLSEHTAAAYLDEMEASGASWIHGYPSLIALVARYALAAGRRLPMRWVTLGAETLLPHQARTIEDAFGVRPVHHYGMAEGTANISMCPLGRLHVDEDYAAVEWIPRGDGSYSVAGVNYSNPAYPLIRYEVGDVVTLLENTSCDCGCPGRIVEAIDGRVEDYVIVRGGARVGRLDHIFKDMVHIAEAQIHQLEPGAIEIRIVRGPDYTDADEARLREESYKRLGRDMGLRVVYVDELPRTAAGKLRFVVSALETGRA